MGRDLDWECPKQAGWVSYHMCSCKTGQNLVTIPGGSGKPGRRELMRLEDL